MASATDNQEPWFLRYTAPVLFPALEGFSSSMSQSAFDTFISDIISSKHDGQEDVDVVDAEEANTETSATIVSLPSDISTTHEIRNTMMQVDLDSSDETQPDATNQHPFINGLVSYKKDASAVPEDIDMENKMFTENHDVAFRSTKSSLVDLFYELEAVVSGPRLRDLLNAAWSDDPLATLKIIFNARSIHLGKASQDTFYRSAGWLLENHPHTLIANLRWLSRPIIMKKAEKKEGGDEDTVMVNVEPEKDPNDMTRFDVKNGVAHGYWKDLLNVLALAVNNKLDALADPKDILNTPKELKRQRGRLTQEAAKAIRHETRDERHKRALTAFDSDPVYRALHVTVTRLFSEQLKADLALLNGNDARAKRNISLCGKWAPSHDRFHDKHTFIVSSIAEVLHPMEEITGGSTDMDREFYLRHARERYRKDIAALRAHLDIVERNLAAKSLDKIKYDRVPSIAMNNYSKVFAEKDTERFEKYLEGVASGQNRISGAVLLPSLLVRKVRHPGSVKLPAKNFKAALTAKMQALDNKVIDGQWKSIVQRIKDSGTLESTIAVCDVSGSMRSPVFPDGTCPMDSAIGLSLLLAEVTAPPFGGHFITFSEHPEVEKIDLSATLKEKIRKMESAKWNMSTNFVSVFEDLILPMAVRNKLSQEDMVKRVFVFSDMQFNEAQGRRQYSNEIGELRFSSSFERIQKTYREAGYEMPELVFWNLAGGRAGYDPFYPGDATAPKPVTSEQEGTALVSGYSQAMLKMFLDNGTFNDPDEEEVKTTEEEGEDAVVVDAKRAKKQKMDTITMVKKAIGHKAYDPLKVVD
ncbi:hypothetical protein GGR57DRAFT_231109 [Xylariaceae sp. FL1272]|nr:hypothetical protein GGR57DRAFT_231109 [Xylariaceae sp. FL1272]